jgi:exopolysaccharide biosynthesis polyprenyl glycosylphosphotransferase
MESREIRLAEFVFFIVDAVLLMSSFLVWALFRFGNLAVENRLYFDQYLILFSLVFFLWFGLSIFLKTHQLDVGVEIRKVLSSFYRLVFAKLSLIAIIVLTLKTSVYYSRIFLFLFFMTYLISGTILRFIWIRLSRIYYRNTDSVKTIITVGKGKRWNRLSAELNRHPEYGYQIIHQLESLKDLDTELQEFDELWVLPEDMISAKSVADKLGIRLRLVPDLGSLGANRTRLVSFGNIPIIEIRPEPLSFFLSSFIKRSLDIILSLIGMIFILTWLTPIVGALIKVNSRGSIFYSQKRIGSDGHKFRIWKYRSMYSNSDQNTQAEKIDDRITLIGRFLRRFHLDELPQLWNVFIGDMSLVGPRPHMISDHSEYARAINNYGIRHWVKPGITGLAQARGLSGSKDIDLMNQRIQADIYYIENWSFLLDLKIILSTLLGQKKWV